ncbi:hypothetical protein Pssp01_17190 [Pseudomonas sp. NBRC 100443]|nr:hypothetical protein Pssp01_17190 [Pseudomonas sp. NBRC 100443]
MDASLDSVAEYSAMVRTAKSERIVRDGQNLFANADDGSEYYVRGLVTSEFKLTSELHLKYHDDGLFVRGSAWYDTQLMDRPPSGGAFALHNTDSDQRYPSDLRNRLGHGTRLLDAYVYGNREIHGMPVSLRLGRQVINWGEGIYYADGLNVANPIDVGRIALPSASLKEALLPTDMVALQVGLSDSLSVEGFYGLDWRGNEVMPTGAFLNDNDVFGKGTNGTLVDLRQQLEAMGVPAGLVPGVNGEDGVVAIARYGKDRDARDGGQFGLALRYLSEALNNTEFSLYYLNYHSKVPFISLRPGTTHGCSRGGGDRFSSLCALAGAVAPDAVPLVDGLALLDSTYYDLVYPEDIRLFGFTLSGNLADTNLAAELTYRPNAPLESSMTWEMEQLANGALREGGGSGAPIDLGHFGSAARPAIDLYQRGELYTTSLSAIHTFGPALGLGNILFRYMNQILPPSRNTGETLLVHETIDQVQAPRMAWNYFPGQRRVRRAPTVAYDNPVDGYVSDDADMYNGAPNRYDWKLLGSKALYVPYNNYRLNQPGLAFADILKPGHLNPDLTRWELHRVWLVEATLKPGERHVYAKRRIYLDEDSWNILMAESYDNRGQLWRVNLAFTQQAYEVPTLTTDMIVYHDLIDRDYSTLGLRSQEKNPRQYHLPGAAGQLLAARQPAPPGHQLRSRHDILPSASRAPGRARLRHAAVRRLQGPAPVAGAHAVRARVYRQELPLHAPAVRRPARPPQRSGPAAGRAAPRAAGAVQLPGPRHRRGRLDPPDRHHRPAGPGRRPHRLRTLLPGQHSPDPLHRLVGQQVVHVPADRHGPGGRRDPRPARPRDPLRPAAQGRRL